MNHNRNTSITLQLSVFLFFVFSLLVISSCKKENIDVMYLYVSGFDLEGESEIADQSIEFVRVVSGAKSLGIFPLPAKIPVLASENKSIRLEPMVEVSGVSDRLFAYSFFEAHTFDLNFVSGKIDTINAVTRYTQQTKFKFEEDFENGISIFKNDIDGFASTTLDVSVDKLRSGNIEGKANIERKSPYVEVSSDVLDFSKLPTEIWLEMDFYGDAVLSVAVLPSSVGTFASRRFRYYQGARGRDNWKRFYFNLSRDELTTSLFTSGFKVGILSQLDSTKTVPNIQHIDNVKLLYR